MRNKFWIKLRAFFRLQERDEFSAPEFYYVEEQREFEQHLEENKLQRAV